MKVSKSISFSVLLLFLLALSACGSSSSSDTSIGNNGPSLAEVAANLEKPDIILPVSPTQNSNNGTSVQESGTGLTATSQPLPNNSNANASFVLNRFLWKPISEGDGNVVVLVDREGVRIEVMGSISETLTDFGPSNERGTTARGNFPGCRYGTDILIEFYDARSGLRLGYRNGDSSVRIPDGCSRLEFDL